MLIVFLIFINFTKVLLFEFINFGTEAKVQLLKPHISFLFPRFLMQYSLILFFLLYLEVHVGTFIYLLKFQFKVAIIIKIQRKAAKKLKLIK